jgi:hypothetical protein
MLGIPIGLVLSACLGGGGGHATTAPSSAAREAIPAASRLRIVSKLGLGTPSLVTHRYTLTCGPPGGTMPDPAAACSAIADYLHRGKPTGCAGLLVLPEAISAFAAITGDFEHRRFKLRLSTASWCGVPRPVMRDFWILSTFPCTTVVTHTGGAKTYADWARASGCRAQA